MIWGTTFLCSVAITTTLLTHRFVIPVFGNILTIVGNTSLGFLVASVFVFILLGIYLMMGLRRSTIKFGFILSVGMYFRQWSRPYGALLIIPNHKFRMFFDLE
jgi:hypothetical protein